MRALSLALIVAAAIAGSDALHSAFADTVLLNASYEPTRRFYSEVNRVFTARWQIEHGEKLTIYQSHAS